jgi:hypothetical protein
MTEFHTYEVVAFDGMEQAKEPIKTTIKDLAISLAKNYEMIKGFSVCVYAINNLNQRSGIVYQTNNGETPAELVGATEQHFDEVR